MHKMSVVLFFVFLLSKVNSALDDCWKTSSEFILAGESFTLECPGRSDDCSNGSAWYFRPCGSKDSKPLNNSDGVLMNCSGRVAEMIKYVASPDDSGEYTSSIGNSEKCTLHVLVVSATLKTQLDVDGKHHGVLLQLFPPIGSPRMTISAFNCTSGAAGRNVIPRYMTDPHWQLVEFEVGEGFNVSQICCNFNVSEGSQSKQLSITPDANPKMIPCGIHSAKESQGQYSAVIRNEISTSATKGIKSLPVIVVIAVASLSTVPLNLRYLFK